MSKINLLILILLVLIAVLFALIFYRFPSTYPISDIRVIPKVVCETYYIDSFKGNNNSDGTSMDKAWKDFVKLQKIVFTPGTKILLKRNGIWYQTLMPPSGGTKEAPIIIDAYAEGATPVIDLQHRIQNGIQINNSYVSIKNLKIQNAQANAITVSVKEGLNQIMLQKLKIFNSGKNGIAVEYGGKNLIISDCHIENSQNNGIYLGGSPQNHLTHVVISDCYIKKVMHNDGITIHRDGQGNGVGSSFLIQKTTVELCGENGFDISSGKDVLLLNNKSSQNSQGGVIIGHDSEEITISGHTSTDEPTEMASAAMNLLSEIGNIRLINSIIKGSGYHLLKIRTHNVAIYNNTFIWNGGRSPIDLAGKIDNINFINNIVFSKQSTMGPIRFLEPSRPPDYKNFNFDHNIYYVPHHSVIFYHNNKKYSFEEYRKEFTVESHSQNVNPNFVNPKLDNYHLKKDSPAIDTGRLLTVPVVRNKNFKVPVNKAIFFYRNQLSKDTQCVNVKGIHEKFHVIDVDYKNNIITLDKILSYDTSMAIGNCFNHSGTDIGAHEF